ncbi:MAG: hypothetical protein K2W95_27375 [Candidatus Obscuribacterales bacterium]|nr:hypothetical protein [Candidatus Obscuribacterales bacterium]
MNNFFQEGEFQILKVADSILNCAHEYSSLMMHQTMWKPGFAPINPFERLINESGDAQLIFVQTQFMTVASLRRCDHNEAKSRVRTNARTTYRIMQ